MQICKFDRKLMELRQQHDQNFPMERYKSKRARLESHSLGSE